MNFKQNAFTLNNECYETINGINFRFVDRKSLYLGMIITFFSGNDIEVYYDENKQIKHDINGIAHFVEHLLFTKKKNNLNMLQELVRKKVVFNGGTGQNATFYHLTDQKENFLNSTMKLIQETAFTLDIDDELISKEHGVISTEASLSSDSVMAKIFETRAKYLEDSSLNYTIAGSVDSVCSITKQDAINFYNSAYTKDNSEVAIYGDFSNNPNLKDEVVAKFMQNMELLEQNYDIVIAQGNEKRVPVLPTTIKLPNIREVIITPKVNSPFINRTYIIGYDKIPAAKNLKFTKKNLEFSLKILSASVSDKIKEVFINNGVDYSKVTIDSQEYKEHNAGIEFSIHFNDINEEKYQKALSVVKSVFKNVRTLVTKDDYETYIQYSIMNQKAHLDDSLPSLVSSGAVAIMEYSRLFSLDEIKNLTSEELLSAYDYEEFASFVENVSLDNDYIEYLFKNK